MNVCMTYSCNTNKDAYYCRDFWESFLLLHPGNMTKSVLWSLSAGAGGGADVRTAKFTEP